MSGLRSSPVTIACECRSTAGRSSRTSARAAPRMYDGVGSLELSLSSKCVENESGS